MRIDIMFPEVANLYGDLSNIEIIKKSYPDIEVRNIRLVDKKLFEKPYADLIYMGTMSEDAQMLVVEKLKPYKAKIQEMIDEGVRFLITGNALEIFGEYIEEKGKKYECLGIFNTYAKRDLMNRFNSLYVGTFEDMEIVGFKSQFTHSHFDGEALPKLFETKRACGLNPDTMAEGIRVKNFMATYIIGPLTILNPPFTKWLLAEMGVKNPKLLFEEDAMKAYEVRVSEYNEPGRGIYYH